MGISSKLDRSGTHDRMLGSIAIFKISCCAVFKQLHRLITFTLPLVIGRQPVRSEPNQNFAMCMKGCAANGMRQRLRTVLAATTSTTRKAIAASG